MTRDKFRFRMLLAAVLPTLIFTAVLSLVWLGWFQIELKDSRNNKVDAIAHQLATAAEFHLFSRDVVALGTLLDAISKEETDIVGVGVFDRQGVLLALNGQNVGLPGALLEATWSEPGRAGQQRLVMPIMASALALDDLYVGPAAQAEVSDQVLGYVVMQVSDAALTSKRNSILAVTASLILLVILAGGLLSYYLSRGITNSIARIVDVVQRIGLGDLAARVELEPKCVLLPLGQGINQMAEKVAMTQDDMQRRIDEATAELNTQKLDAEREARVDALTQLSNRRAFMEQAETEAQRAARYGTPLSLVILDLDYFKQINDIHGHDVGDLVLIELSEHLRSLMREVDLVYRFGGEEFAILLPGTAMAEAVQVAERVREDVERMRVSAGDRAITCTASFGVSEFQDDDSIQALFVRADQALYRAKQAGRNRVEY